MWTSAASVPSGFCWVWVMRESCPVRQSGFRVQYQGKDEICAERMAFLSCLIYPQIQAFAPLEQAHCIPYPLDLSGSWASGTQPAPRAPDRGWCLPALLTLGPSLPFVRLGAIASPN